MNNPHEMYPNNEIDNLRKQIKDLIMENQILENVGRSLAGQVLELKIEIERLKEKSK